MEEELNCVKRVERRKHARTRSMEKPIWIEITSREQLTRELSTEEVEVEHTPWQGHLRGQAWHQRGASAPRNKLK
jgi:hypothetical protein